MSRQLKAHLRWEREAIFVPYKYQTEQIEIIAREIIPRLRKRSGRVQSGFDIDYNAGSDPWVDATNRRRADLSRSGGERRS